ncbi:MAG: nitroreductase family protein [Gemmatimonadetes bacterium]|nr:nitroreductase family protein [Gemmatimonadota bacterium]
MTDVTARSPVLDALLTRRSVGALADPAPSADQLETILRAATTAPDHGGLRPYRFVVIDAPRHARFGEALAHDTDLARGGITEEVKAKFRKKAGTAPVQVLIIFSPVESTKAPEWEQLVTAVLHRLPDAARGQRPWPRCRVAQRRGARRPRDDGPLRPAPARARAGMAQHRHAGDRRPARAGAGGARRARDAAVSEKCEA